MTKEDKQLKKDYKKEIDIVYDANWETLDTEHLWNWINKHYVSKDLVEKELKEEEYCPSCQELGEENYHGFCGECKEIFRNKLKEK